MRWFYMSKNFFEETITYLSALSAQEAVERKQEDTAQKKLAEAYAAQYEKLETQLEPHQAEALRRLEDCRLYPAAEVKTTVYIRAFRDCWNFFRGLSECE